VRLARTNAETLFALVRSRGMSNTRVVITDGAARETPVARETPRSAPMAREHRFERDPGFERFGAREYRPAPRRVIQYEAPRPVRAEFRSAPSGDASREVWLRSLDRKYGANTR
jgi:hypothetical protein